MIDQIVILGYLACTLFIGIYSAYRSKKSYIEFSATSTQISSNSFILMTSIFSTSIGAGTIFGLTSKIISNEITYAFGLMISIFTDIFVVNFLIPKIMEFKKFLTLGEVMNKYYGKIGKFTYGISVVFVSLGFLSAQISISGEIFGYFTGMSNIIGVLASYIVVIIYTSLGGLHTVILTDIVQFIFMTLSIPYIAISYLYLNGDFINDAINHVSTHKNLLTGSISLALAFSVMSLNPTYLQRILMSRDTKIAKQSSYAKIIVYVIFISMIIVIGLSGKIMNYEGPSNQFLSYLIDKIIPSGLKGFVFCGILGALMSTVDSNLHIASVSFVDDIISIFFKPKEAQKLLLTRGFIVLFGIIAIFVSLKFQNVIDLVIFMSGFWGPIIIPPLIFLLYGISIKPYQFIICVIGGVCTFLIFYMYNPYFILPPLFMGTMINSFLFTGFFVLNKRCKIGL